MPFCSSSSVCLSYRWLEGGRGEAGRKAEMTSFQQSQLSLKSIPEILHILPFKSHGVEWPNGIVDKEVKNWASVTFLRKAGLVTKGEWITAWHLGNLCYRDINYGSPLLSRSLKMIIKDFSTVVWLYFLVM